MERTHTSHALDSDSAAQPAHGHVRAPRPRLRAPDLAAVFAGGFIGTVVRAALAEGLPVRAGRWPWATFAVNIAGTALLGFLLTRWQERPPASQYQRPFLAAGVCGALTTFSTLVLELQQMLARGHTALAAAYASASVLGGLAAVVTATRVARRGGLLR